MLVLSRNGGEEIIIGDDIRVTVIEVRKGRVRLGFAAPRDVRIVRSELRRYPPRIENEDRDKPSKPLSIPC